MKFKDQINFQILVKILIFQFKIRTNTIFSNRLLKKSHPNLFAQRRAVCLLLTEIIGHLVENKISLFSKLSIDVVNNQSLKLNFVLTFE